ncbi:MAG: NADH:flavin oxidoreductase/NADH oxidase [Bacteroidetes bacterium]|nr:NADH:flavin oxidoreductase/NADH oxidase [Bacteroidota bacterium]
MSFLFEPFSLNSITFRNRLVMSPMCQYTAQDGFANNWHLVHYGSRAVGGAALIIQEATAISPEGRISPGDLGIYKVEHIQKLSEIVEFIKQQGTIAGIQLAHAGRKAGCNLAWKGGKQLSTEEGGWTRYAPSSIAFQPDEELPVEMTVSDIQKVISDFCIAAERAKKAGYQVIEIHAAHGYLLHEFLSPLSNHRTDSYGGSFENRVRLLLEVATAMRKVLNDGELLFVRISATDWAEGGWDVNEAIDLCKQLKMIGADLIDCSSGGLIPTARIPLGPGYQVDFADRIRIEANVPTGAVGLITNAAQAEAILMEGKADLVILGRVLLRDPYFPMNAAGKLEHDIDWPLQYSRAKQ